MTYEEIKTIESKASTKDEKLRGLYRLVASKFSDLGVLLADSSRSLIGLLMFSSIKKFVQVMRRDDESPFDGCFLRPEHIRELERLNLADTANIVDIQLKPENLAEIKRRYDELSRELMRFSAKENRKLQVIFAQ